MRERLGNVDAAWFSMDRPENTADVVGLLVLDRLPPHERLRAVLQERLVPCPRFRQRVVPGPLLSAGAWEDDPQFDLERHLMRVHLADGAPALAARLGAVASAPLDRAHPLWRVEAIEGRGVAALAFKLHHCMADGFALVAALVSMADDPPPPRAAPRALVGYQRMAPWLDPARALLPALRHPASALALAGQGAALAAALARMTALPPDPPPWQRPLTGTRRLAWSGGAPLSDVRRAARAHAGTVNDVLLAALSGALRAELAREGERVDALSLRAFVPVNLRPGLPDVRAGEMGNRFGLVYLDLPVAAATARERVAGVQAGMCALKRRPDAVAAYGMLGAVGLLHPLAHALCGFYSRKASVVVTNVPGPREKLHLAGQTIDHAMFWVPHPSTLGVGVSLLTYGGEVRVGVRADVAVLPEPDRLVAAFERELAALVPPTARARRRTARPAASAGAEAAAL